MTRDLHLTVPVLPDRLYYQSIPCRFLSARPVKKLLQTGSPDQSLAFWYFPQRLFAADVCAQCVGESFHSQKALCFQILPDRCSGYAFRHILPVLLLGRGPPCSMAQQLIDREALKIAFRSFPREVV